MWRVYWMWNGVEQHEDCETEGRARRLMALLGWLDETHQPYIQRRDPPVVVLRRAVA
jgi:hypothetical protein